MRLVLINFPFRYETENIIRIFFPFEKLEYSDSNSGSGSFAELKTDENNVLSVRININGSEYERKYSVPSPDDKETERLGALGVYEILSEYTSYTPPWGILTGVRPSKLMRSLIAGSGEDGARDYFENKLVVSSEKTSLAMEVARAEDRIISLSNDNSYSLYVSIPFCPTRCSYCSFVSHSITQAKKLIPDYVRLLCKELELTGKIAYDLGLRLETVYFGGGTPTSLSSEDLKAITDAVKANFDIKNAREYTVEAGRPDTLDEDKLRVLKNAGVGRISVNPQTFVDSVLKNIGRAHTSDDTVRAFMKAREVGFDNINMDLIAGLPGDNPDTFEMSVNKAIELSAENITVHTLALKRASSLVTEGHIDSVSRDTVEMLSRSSKNLRSAGYAPYYMYRQSKCVGNNENVGYGKHDKECLYNIYMMEEVHTVLAAGAGAVTKLKDPGSNNVERIFNFKYPYEYINRFDELNERKKRISEFYENERTDVSV